MTAAPNSFAWNEEMLGTTSFILGSTPNCPACLVEATKSAPNAILTKTLAPLLAMLSERS